MIKKFKLSILLKKQVSLVKNNDVFDYLIKKTNKTYIKRNNGRNNQGKITVQYKGGGSKHLYRIIEFNREKNKIIGVVKTINFDPNRSSFIAGILIRYNLFLKRIVYIIAPHGIKKGDYVDSGCNSQLKIGSSLCLKNIPVGSLVHNVCMEKLKNGILSRSAGTFCKVLQRKNSYYSKIRLRSGEEKLIQSECFATLGVVSNINHHLKKIGKAGKSRWLNKRPHVRGVAKNPIDHPHGGGEGKTSGGRPSVTPKGKITKGKPTRKRKKLIIL
jgi:large subunit ribosomal protein L2